MGYAGAASGYFKTEEQKLSDKIKLKPQGLVHQNKFVGNKEPLYVLHEDKVVFNRIVKAGK